MIVHFIELIERGACHVAPLDLAALVPRTGARLEQLVPTVEAPAALPQQNSHHTAQLSGGAYFCLPPSGPLAAGPFRGRCERFKFLLRTGVTEYLARIARITPP